MIPTRNRLRRSRKFAFGSCCCRLWWCGWNMLEGRGGEGMLVGDRKGDGGGELTKTIIVKETVKTSAVDENVLGI